CIRVTACLAEPPRRDLDPGSRNWMHACALRLIACRLASSLGLFRVARGEYGARICDCSRDSLAGRAKRTDSDILRGGRDHPPCCLQSSSRLKRYQSTFGTFVLAFCISK